ncbi:5'-3' exoribonuclease [Trichinella spiralis]|uniref:5'-3' exoribonuclease n=1 Tax=Trichinella spiralis TaxID=6334 RepID=A0ABR3KF71_TRISP
MPPVTGDCVKENQNSKTDGVSVDWLSQDALVKKITRKMARKTSPIYEQPGEQLSDGTAEKDGDEGEENFPLALVSNIAEGGRCWNFALAHECKERNAVAERFQK